MKLHNVCISTTLRIRLTNVYLNKYPEGIQLLCSSVVYLISDNTIIRRAGNNNNDNIYSCSYI